ncbi:hypothetical protein PQJ75_13015 [Rhodoplanes sp. TEM]|uniref:Uncharacterized protein n=1 Tax=Rhodoplanes tepidamans TaxID=200616 RepID=A0ABT5J6L1_RHOTP|nr:MULTISPECIES: hypothetical protein [Rhodoplanes]MDC7785281.1 hypothetical protein [Rhodoplanes tepidamans]MDC7984652.1 hypothetical protein [Rhodoplanes sp. TEM]MDQ0353539.1 hypothetical protein [Rhodoplanes tepidamans]
MKTMVHYAVAAGLAGALALATVTPSDAQSRRAQMRHQDRVATQTYAPGYYGNPVAAGVGVAGEAARTGVGLAAGAVGAGVGLATGIAGAALSPLTGGYNAGWQPGYEGYASAGPVAAAPGGGGCWISTDLNRGYGYYGPCGTRRADFGVASISGQPGTQGTVLPYPLY